MVLSQKALATIKRIKRNSKKKLEKYYETIQVH
jgi:hypothetical protein